MRQLALLTAAVGLASLISGSASATTVTFGTCVSNNVAGDCAIASAQISVLVGAGPSAGQVTFTFSNVGASASSITDIYFDDGTLLGIASVTNSSGVSFSQGASPGNLPAGNNASPAFVATAGFTADSDAPVQPNGVNPGETVTIVFNLQSGGTFGDVLAELGDGRLRIGVHVQGFASGGSEALVNTPVPEAGTLGLLAVSLFGLARAGRRR